MIQLLLLPCGFFGLLLAVATLWALARNLDGLANIGYRALWIFALFSTTLLLIDLLKGKTP